MTTQENEPQAAFITEAQVWGYVQETNKPEFHACPRCGQSEGVWVGFVRLSRDCMVRKKRCGHCGRVYRAAVMQSAFREIDNWEARWLLRWRPYFDEWMEARKQSA